MKSIKLPLTDEIIKKLHCGDMVLLSGVVLTGRDAAHKRIVTAMRNGEKLPFEIAGNVIYYVGPAPASEGHAVGPAGPTTSYRMDSYTPFLLEHGLKGMIGKGLRGDEVKQSIIKNRAVYFAAVGGAAALLSKHIRSARIVAYEDLGTEAVHEFELVDFPVVVAMDSEGNDIYKRPAFK